MAKKTTQSPVQLTLKSGKSRNLLSLLGISEKRMRELQKAITDSVDTANGSLSKLLFEISKGCNNPNELAIASFVAGKAIAEAMRDSQRADVIEKVKAILEKAKKKK